MNRVLITTVALSVVVFGILLVPALSQTEVKPGPSKSPELQAALKRNDVLKEELADLTRKHDQELTQLRRQKVALETALTSRGIELPKESRDGRDPTTAAMVTQMLQEIVETKGVQEPVKLKAALEYFADKFRGRLAVLLDQAAFAAQFGEDGPNPYDELVVLPPVPARMHFGTALRLLVSQVARGQATYVIRRGYIEIVPEKYTTSPYFLYQPTVAVAYVKRPLTEILHDLGEETGITIDLDPGVGKKAAATPITTTFRNCSLEDALTPLTEMAQLKYVVLHRSIYVTTAARAQVLEKEEGIRRDKRKLAPRIEKGKRLEPAAE